MILRCCAAKWCLRDGQRTEEAMSRELPARPRSDAFVPDRTLYSTAVSGSSERFLFRRESEPFNALVKSAGLGFPTGAQLYKFLEGPVRAARQVFPPGTRV